MQATKKNAIEILREGGVVAVGDWCAGSGRYVRRRPTPAGCAEVKVRNIDTALRGATRLAARRLLRARPRITSMICVTDRRAVSRWLRELAAEAQAARAHKAEAAEAQSRMLSAAEKAAESAFERARETRPTLRAWAESATRHPAPAAILAMKRESGMSWSEFEARARTA